LHGRTVEGDTDFASGGREKQGSPRDGGNLIQKYSVWEGYLRGISNKSFRRVGEEREGSKVKDVSRDIRATDKRKEHPVEKKG